MGRFTIADGPMNRSKETGFAERQSAAAAAKKAALERHRAVTNDPQLAERQMARQAVKLARDTRVAERRAALDLWGAHIGQVLGEISHDRRMDLKIVA